MHQALRSPVIRYGGAIFLVVLVALILLPGLRMSGASAANFLPHATCYLQDARLIWLHASTDALIGLAYLAISATMAFLIYRARADIPFHWMFMAFGLFIVTCGVTHIMAVINVWRPLYWLSGDIKVITATASVATAVALPFMVPRVFALIRAAKLSEERQRRIETANAELRSLNEKIRGLDELKSQFFANVTHELRTPLTLVLGPAHTLEQSPSLSPEQRSDAATIRSYAALLLKHVNDLLDASRLESRQMSPDYSRFDLAALVRITCSHFSGMADERELLLQVNLPDQCWLEADASNVQRVLLNLLGNAFKFVPTGGSIRCELHGTESSVQIVVQDTGPGVPPAMQAAVFERFRQVEGNSTRRFGGTGLGLTIVKDLVELHRGCIDLSDTPGGGATFTVTLPRQAPTGTPVRPADGDFSFAPPHDPAEAYAGKRGRREDPVLPAASDDARPLVLVVEDDPDMNRFITAILSRSYRTACAFDGREGLEAVRRLSPDVILSDIMMPEMDGEELLSHIQAEPDLCGIPFILLSAKAEEDLRLRLLEAGANDFIMKPFQVKELEARVANFVAMAGVRTTLQRELRVREQNVISLARETVRRKKETEEALLAQQKAEEALRLFNLELEAKIVERTSELSTANQELEMFIHSVSHDLRSPLRTMSGMISILLDEHAATFHGPARAYLERTLGAANRMEILVNDLVHYSRTIRGPAELEPVSLASAIQTACSSLAREIEERRAELTVEPTDAKVLAQESLLAQILQNLLSNAMRYVAPGVTPRVRVSVKELDLRIRILVTDNGIGIAPENQEKIFQMFQRLHPFSEYPGSGLGLAILSKAVGRMNGSFGVESTPGRGSCFWIEIAEAPRPPETSRA